MRRMLLLAALAGVALPGVAQAQWVFLARKAIGRVEQLTKPKTETQPGYDLASVLLQAPTPKVFAAVVKGISENPGLHLVSQDARSGRVAFSNGAREADITVTPLGPKLTQMMILAVSQPGQPAAAPLILDGVLGVCRKLGVVCSKNDG